MKMRFENGKSKTLTLSYDDGCVQDIRLVEILNKHKIKATFNINTGCYLPEEEKRERFFGRLKQSEAIELYKNSCHEVAVHSLTHPFLEKLRSSEVLFEITEDRKNIEAQFGTIARGMAYPFGTYSESVLTILEKCEIAYSRTVEATRKFDFPKNWLLLHPTCHHNDPKLLDLIKGFVETPAHFGNAQMFYLWGHSYEFDNNNNWNVIEEFAKYAGGRDNIWYATNIEIYDYVKAFERLQTSFDNTIVHNPSSLDVWFEEKGKLYLVKAGQTINTQH